MKSVVKHILSIVGFPEMLVTSLVPMKPSLIRAKK